MAHIIEVRCNHWPTFLHKICIEPIRARGFAEGRVGTTFSLENGASKHDRSRVGCKSVLKSKAIIEPSELPNLSLYDSNKIAALPWWVEISWPTLLWRVAIVFVLCRNVKFARKNLVPASPHLAHLISPLYFQYIFCYSSKVSSFYERRSLKFHTWIVKSLLSSIKSINCIINLMFLVTMFRLGRLLCHF